MVFCQLGFTVTSLVAWRNWRLAETPQTVVHRPGSCTRSSWVVVQRACLLDGEDFVEGD